MNVNRIRAINIDSVRVRSRRGRVLGNGVEEQVGVGNVVTLIAELVPEGAVDDLDIVDDDVGRVTDGEWDWTSKRRRRAPSHTGTSCSVC